MHTPSSYMNGGSHNKFNLWDSSFMWDEGVFIYGTLGVHNNFS